MPCVSVCFSADRPHDPPAIEAGNLVRRLRPELPIIFGGWHPTLLPEQTLKADYADAVVRGQGELTFLHLLQTLREGKSLDGVAGISFKEGDRVLHTAERPVMNLNKLPMPAYHLVDFDAYERACGIRKTVYASSVGCPYACNYCTDTVFYNRKFNALTAQRVVSEVTELVQRYRLDEISFLDSNFPVDVRRALQIARGFIASGTRFRWTFQASTDLLCRMKDEDVQLLAAAGVSHVGFGTESAAEEVLEMMNKPHQRIPEMFETARKCQSADIKVTFNLIIYPGETEAHRAETLKVMVRFPPVLERRFSPNIFTPYPDCDMEPASNWASGEPQSLEEWASSPWGESPAMAVAMSTGKSSGCCPISS
jgi:radical SAM superfamily enzyme YgiQ (UPF0313 family)